MKYYLLCGILLFAITNAFPQKMDASQIRQKMAEIRRTTNWDNAAEAKKANDEIRELSKQLMMSGKKNNSPNDEHAQEQLEKGVEYKSNLFKQMWDAAKKGENADVLLAEPLRKQIVEEYKEDESPANNPEFFNKMTMLCIDMSQPAVQKTIEQMDKFKSIKTLIIMSGKSGAPVDLTDLLNRALHYPLKELYIINFKFFVTSIPKQVGVFKNLELLSLINNQIKILPAEAGKLTKLKTLYVDINPVTTILPVIRNFHQLENLGIAKTNISRDEIDKIKKQLPHCKIEVQ